METNLEIAESEEHEDDLPRLEQACILWSNTNVYIVQELLGSGTFGNVVQGVVRGTNEKVAIKIMKDQPRVVKDAEDEVEILSQLNKENPDEFNVVKYYEYFQHNDNICLVFEMLEISLYDFMKKRNNRPLPVKHIRPIVQQVGNALAKLKSIQIIHTDLKPENIMLVNTSKYPFKIKVIDFGCAIHTSKVRVSSYVQTRYYRSPEIILALPFWEAIDMWSVGCITAELFTGYPLYPGASAYDQIRYITETQGLPPDKMLDWGANTENYFRIDGEREDLLWSLKSKIHYEYETGIRPMERRRYVFSSLDDMTKIILPSKLEGSDTLVEMADIWQFLDLLKEMLTIDPDKRITPICLLSHPFITMAHLQHFTRSSYVNPCFQAMKINEEQVSIAIVLLRIPLKTGGELLGVSSRQQCAAEDIMVSPACGMGIIIHNSNYNVNTDIEQEVCPEPPEMETESPNEEDKKEQLIEEDSGKEEEKKKNERNERLLELYANAIALANKMGLAKEISSQTEAEPLGACESSPSAQIEIQDQVSIAIVLLMIPLKTGGELLGVSSRQQCAAEDVMVSPACGMGIIIIHNSNYNVNTAIEQEVCPEPPEMETESPNEEDKKEQLIEEDSGKKEKEKKNDRNERLLELHANSIALANEMGLAKEILSETEAEPLGACESSPSAQIEIQDQHAQDGPLLEESSEAEGNCEVVAEDIVPDTQETPAQCGKDTSDENEIEILSEFDEGDKEEEEKKKKKRGSCMRRVLRALCCCFHRKPKKLKVNTPETSDVIIYQVHGLQYSSSESSTDSKAAASTHSSLPSERSAGLLRKWKCVNDLSQIE
ncbi:Homeodomain-interacting kinase 2 [Pelobates cultripes]|uniref:Homeodomain-interacting kinase 2, partial n=1 Tax=Pelobates cultripes TaxID=61616 RepID=A0AAD1STN8_PELCU|nr:Homeodomain-interacting kinase 2 [Pelobates cultripes]